MTDFDASRDDELVSAYLDGEATPDERARVEHDPRLQQRLADFRRVAAAVGTPHLFADTPDRDALLARAVAQSPIERRPTADSRGGDAPVVDLAARRRRNTIILSAAAAVIVVALAVPALLRDSDSNEVGTGLEVASEGLGDEPDATQDEGAAPRDDNADGLSAPSTTVAPPDTTTRSTVGGGATGAPLPPVDLGTFASRGEAQARVTDAIDQALTAGNADFGGARSSILGGEGGSCAAEVERSDDELVRLVYAATFELPDGRHQVLVYELTTAGAVNGTHRIYEQLLPACQHIGVQTI